jgi:hypothetical protein
LPAHGRALARNARRALLPQTILLLLLAQSDYGSRCPYTAPFVDAGRARQPRHICRIDGSDNLLAGLL